MVRAYFDQIDTFHTLSFVFAIKKLKLVLSDYHSSTLRDLSFPAAQVAQIIQQMADLKQSESFEASSVANTVADLMEPSSQSNVETKPIRVANTIGSIKKKPEPRPQAERNAKRQGDVFLDNPNVFTPEEILALPPGFMSAIRRETKADSGKSKDPSDTVEWMNLRVNNHKSPAIAFSNVRIAQIDDPDEVRRRQEANEQNNKSRGEQRGEPKVESSINLRWPPEYNPIHPECKTIIGITLKEDGKVVTYDDIMSYLKDKDIMNPYLLIDANGNIIREEKDPESDEIKIYPGETPESVLESMNATRAWLRIEAEMKQISLNARAVGKERVAMTAEVTRLRGIKNSPNLAANMTKVIELEAKLSQDQRLYITPGNVSGGFVEFVGKLYSSKHKTKPSQPRPTANISFNLDMTNRFPANMPIKELRGRVKTEVRSSDSVEYYGRASKNSPKVFLGDLKSMTSEERKPILEKYPEIIEEFSKTLVPVFGADNSQIIDGESGKPVMEPINDKNAWRIFRNGYVAKHLSIDIGVYSAHAFGDSIKRVALNIVGCRQKGEHEDNPNDTDSTAIVYTGMDIDELEKKFSGLSDD